MASLIEKGWNQPGLINFLLLPLSYLYGIAMKLRFCLYRWNVKSSHELGVPVIVVGNLTAGGTGKTPLVIALVQELKAKGYSPGVISRGYRANPPFTPFEVDGHSEVDQVGDEPLLIYKRCCVPVVIGADRILSGRTLIDKYNCDVIVSDDGFQHLRLQRDLDIVVVDGQRGLGNGWCLPAGPLREFKSALHRADIVVINGESQGYPPELPENGYRNYPMQVEPATVEKAEAHPAETYAVAGLGNPERFFAMLDAHGIAFSKKAFPDHHHYREEDFAFANETSVIYMTEKDAVKCENFSIVGRVIVVAISAYLPESFFSFIFDRLDAANKSD